MTHAVVVAKPSPLATDWTATQYRAVIDHRTYEIERTRAADNDTWRAWCLADNWHASAPSLAAATAACIRHAEQRLRPLAPAEF